MRHRKNANQRYHDRVAGRYEAVYDDFYWQWHDALTWNYFKKHLPSNLNSPVVDLGCGSGKWGRKLLKSGFHVTFVDLSAKMVDEARRQVLEMGGSDKASFLQADLVDLSQLPENHFGLALAMGEPICLANPPRQAVRQIARCLKPGGVLVATFDNRVACADFYVEKGKPEELEKFLRTGKTRWLTRDPNEQFEITTFTPEQARKLLLEAGLEPLEIVGKTVLPMRHHREKLEDASTRRRWARIEEKLARDPSNLARCAHLQIAARKPNAPAGGA